RLGSRKAFSFEPVIKTPFDLLKHLAVWQLQEFNKKSKGVPMGKEKSLAHTRWNCKYHIFRNHINCISRPVQRPKWFEKQE
ncbi:hypothetical protein D3029_25365, partial [Escherichia coli]|nr:hypothetical protein [Escherichia coli]EFN9261712.1 hypothetical protein [Escherichia coli]